MSRRAILMLLSAVAAVVILLPIGFFSSMGAIERQRIADATPAFAPIESLRPAIFSQPVAFHRNCRYVVDFSPESKLSDDNISTLRSLNRLPQRNTLDVTIRTKAVTDASIPVLESLDTVDTIWVDDSGISNEGIRRLRVKLAERIYSTRQLPD